MSRMLVSLLLAALCVHQSSATCHADARKIVKALHDPESYDSMVKSLSGDYTFKYVSAGELNEFFDGECMTATLEGSSIEYKGAIDGKFAVTLKNSGLQQADQAGEVQMTSYVLYKKDDVLVLYTCSSYEKDSAMASIAVRSDSTNSEEAVQEAKQVLQTLGVPEGINLLPCSV